MICIVTHLLHYTHADGWTMILSIVVSTISDILWSFTSWTKNSLSGWMTFKNLGISEMDACKLRVRSRRPLVSGNGEALKHKIMNPISITCHNT
jgi:hypothetical protein